MQKEKVGKTESRRLALEKWKKSKEEAKQLMKKMTKPPFRLVGKSTLMNHEKSYLDKILSNSTFKSTRLHTTQFNQTSSKFSSTPFVKNKPKFLPKPFKKALSPKRNPRRNTFDIETPIISKLPKLTPKSHSKSVQFQENIIKISPKINSSIEQVPETNEEKIHEDYERRVSRAGETPFSCTSSRSGSTPGRRDCPTTLTNLNEGETLTQLFSPKITSNQTKNTPKSASRKSRSPSGHPIMRWYVPRNSIIERDPYLLRSQTPVRKIDFTKPLEVKSTPRKSIATSAKKKSMKVSFGITVVNKISPDESENRSPSLDDTLRLLRKSPEPSSCLPASPIVLGNSRMTNSRIYR